VMMSGWKTISPVSRLRIFPLQSDGTFDKVDMRKPGTVDRTRVEEKPEENAI